MNRWAGYAVTAGADAALAAAGAKTARRFTKPLLMPLLAAAVGRPARLRGALLGSWIGDVALLTDRPAGLLGGIGGFAGAHVAYLGAIGNRGRHRTLPAVGFATTYVASSAGLWRAVGDKPLLRLPLLGYGALVSTMGYQAVRAGLDIGGRTGRRLAAGGILFVFSDGLVALSLFGPRKSRVVDAAVMLTYTAAQALLADALADE